MAGSLASINIRFFVGLKELSSDLQNATRELRKRGDEMKEAGKSLSLYVTAPIVAAGIASGKMASDFEESTNKVNVAFKDSANVVQAFAKNSLNSFGIAEGSALDMAAGYGDMATSMGLAEAQAAGMSKGLVSLAGDLASFKNKGIDQTSKALEGIFTGETESLKMLGIVMTEANLAQFALSKGVTKNIKDFTQAEKVQLRYAYVMAQTTNAQGDFARTGGGAANQTRVLQEGMKELGAQFGQVILPAFTSLIHSVNGIISSLQQMDPEVRKIVVGFGLAAAAAGPVLVALGSMINAYATVRVAVASLNATILANPYTAAAIALGAIVTTVVLATSRWRSLTDANEEFNNVMAEGSDAIARESAEMNKNLAIAQNEKQSKENRLAAIQALNAISPKYLGNLTLENINTKAATDATLKYTDALKQKARVMAAQEKLVEVEKKLLDLQLGQLDAVKPSLWQNLGNAFKSGGNSALYAAYGVESLALNLMDENSELGKLQEKLVGFINGNQDFVESQNAAASATDSLNLTIAESAKSGTVDYYNERISAIQKLRDAVATTTPEFQKFSDKIDELEKRRDALEGKRPQVISVTESVGGLKAPEMEKSDSRKSVDFFQAQITKLEELQSAYTQADAEFKNFQAQIEGYKMSIAIIVDPASVIKSREVLNTFSEDLKKRKQEFQDSVAQFNENVGVLLESAAESFVAGFAEVIGSIGSGTDAMKGVFTLLLSTLSDVAIQIGKAAIAIGLTMEGIKASFSNPGLAIAAGVTLIAVGSALKKSLPKFEDGGIVGGNSFYGDKILARLNSGEMVLNRGQQKNIFDMINRAPTVDDFAVQLSGGFELDGAKLRLVLERSDKIKNRTE